METVLCLHASASAGRQWRPLSESLGTDYRLLTPDLLGYGDGGFARSGRFSLDDEVEHVLAQLDDGIERLHVVGHSYGGAVALRFAQRFPRRVASLTVYEPAQPLLLFEDGLHTSEAREARSLREIFVNHATSTFGRWRAAREYVNYWSGRDAWQRLTFARRRRITGLVPKIAAELDALFSASAALGDVSALTMPVTILFGSRTRRTAKRVCELLQERIRGSRLQSIDGLEHMGPLTHAHVVNPLIAEHLGQAA
ncbi:MAG: alpha/beta fold hydrolase [Woeseiaceae bacterium]|nr:alpha/beta fold hydrolase [Woeseiaceae bacterium]